MALLVVCGQPSSGKSGVAEKLAAAFRALGHEEVTIVDEPSLGMIRNQSYKDAVNEKHTRGKLKSAVERALSKKSIVILDSLNNIKGYRYELWCVARSIGTKYCMVHVDSPVDRCKEWNSRRQGDASYSESVFRDLAGRFERPDARSRWDSPLFTVHPEEVLLTPSSAQQPSAAPEAAHPRPAVSAPASASASASDPAPAPASASASTSDPAPAPTSAPAGPSQPERSSWVRAEGPGPSPPPPPPAPSLPAPDPWPRNDAQGMTHAMVEARVPTLDEALAVGELQLGPPENVDLEGPDGEQQVLEAIVRAMSDLDRSVGEGSQRGGGARPQLKASFATNSTPMLGTNTLHEIDQAAQSVVDAVSDAGAAAAGGAAGLVHFGGGLHALQLSQPVGLAELRRHKRAFLKLATKIMFARLQGSDSAKRMFIEYLGDNVAGASIAPR